jgi:SAM-dependent methyltransferase
MPPDPGALVAEAVRVLRPEGRLVLAHSDFDILVFASEDLELTRRLVRDYCDTQQPWMDAVDGMIGRRLADIAGQAGLLVEDVQAAVVLGRRFVPGGHRGDRRPPHPGRRSLADRLRLPQLPRP